MARRYVGKDDDLRVRKTKRAIKDATLELMHENPSHTPSATAIIQRANINKSTFYYHYESVQDLLDSLEQELFDDVMTRALNDIGLLASNPSEFLARFGAFAYEEPLDLPLWSGRLKTSMFEALLTSATKDDAFPSLAAVEVVLLGLWGYTRRVTREEYERSMPALAAMLTQGLARPALASPMPACSQKRRSPAGSHCCGRT